MSPASPLALPAAALEAAAERALAADRVEGPSAGVHRMGAPEVVNEH